MLRIAHSHRRLPIEDWHDLATHLEDVAARGEMNLRKLLLLKHDSKLGSARSADVLSTVRVDRTGDPSQSARSWSDYAVSIGEMPAGVEAIEIV